METLQAITTIPSYRVHRPPLTGNLTCKRLPAAPILGVVTGLECDRCAQPEYKFVQVWMTLPIVFQVLNVR